MLNKEQQQFLRYTLKELINKYEKDIGALGLFNILKKSEYNSFIVRFKDLIIKLDDEKDILEKMTLGEVGTLRNISYTAVDNIKKIPNFKENENLIIDITLAIECIKELSKELSEVDNAENHGVHGF